MIKYATGSIFDSEAEVLVNPVNCVGAMGRGLAAEFKVIFHENFEKYYWGCYYKQVKIGDIFSYEFEPGSKHRFIANFPTKIHWKDPSSIKYIHVGLLSLVRWLKREEVKSIAIPKLGCGLGRLPWKQVHDQIVEHLGNLEGVEVELYGEKP